MIVSPRNASTLRVTVTSTVPPLVQRMAFVQSEKIWEVLDLMLVVAVSKPLALTNVPVGVTGVSGVHGCPSVSITTMVQKIQFSMIKLSINLNDSDHVIVLSKTLLVH